MMNLYVHQEVVNTGIKFIGGVFQTNAALLAADPNGGGVVMMSVYNGVQEIADMHG